jgi:hypothetical protein
MVRLQRLPLVRHSWQWSDASREPGTHLPDASAKVTAMRSLATLLAIATLTTAQTKTTWEDFPGYTFSNGIIDVTVLSTGGTIASIVLNSDKEKLNPLWDPIRFARETGSPNRPRGAAGLGHFLCVDGFGPISKEEAAAGMKGHGEAHRLVFETKLARTQNGNQTLTIETELPLVQERLTRTYEVREGENVVYVRSQLQSLVAFDRPLVWAEHATIGSPFLEAGITVVDMPAKRAQTRPHERSGANHRLASGKDFDWPMAPTLDGKTVDVRAAPVNLGSGDHTTSLMDPARPYAFATAIHPQKRLIVGWLWRQADFPWLQSWEHYPANGKLARGLEFSTQPYDITRRDAVGMHQLFGAPTYQWLPAKSTVEKSWVMFYAPAPEGMTKVTDVRLEKSQILIEDGDGRRITLRATGTL